VCKRQKKKVEKETERLSAVPKYQSCGIIWGNVLAVTAFRPPASSFGKDFGKLGLRSATQGIKTLCPSFCIACDEMSIPAPALILQRLMRGWERNLLSPPALPLGHFAVAWGAEPSRRHFRTGNVAACVAGVHNGKRVQSCSNK